MSSHSGIKRIISRFGKLFYPVSWFFCQILVTVESCWRTQRDEGANKRMHRGNIKNFPPRVEDVNAPEQQLNFKEGSRDFAQVFYTKTYNPRIFSKSQPQRKAVAAEHAQLRRENFDIFWLESNLACYQRYALFLFKIFASAALSAFIKSNFAS